MSPHDASSGGGGASEASTAKLAAWWAAVQDSLWFMPALFTAAAVALAFFTVWLDTQVGSGLRADLFLIFGGGAEGARGVLSSISGSLITVTGVVFSVTIVALQLASSQFTPRVLRNFTSDRSVQVVLGVFIGTFTYALLVQRKVRSATETAPGFVPAISVTIAVALAVASTGAFIFFINHMARQIQASVVIARATDETLRRVRHLFPEPVKEPYEPDEDSGLRVPGTEPGTIAAQEAGYLQAIDGDALTRVAVENDLVLRMEPTVGQFVLRETVIASVWPADRARDGDIADAVRRTVVLGEVRTIHEDVEFGIIQLVDIAIKALSPAVNAPTTAVICLDRLGEVLSALGSRDPPSRFQADEQGELRLVLDRQPFDHIVDIAFDPIRGYGASDATVMAHLLETLRRVAEQVPEERRAPLVEQGRAVLDDADRSVANPKDLLKVERAGGWLP